ncbi:MAG TPA: HAD family hydrolase [Candidatus Acidoferrum sp.]|nr:HAD family hydrolase [Candidatus Acidoferrum sp.]
MRPAVFLDRDGTILDEVGYLNHASRFRMLPGAAAAIAKLNAADDPVIVVSNQSGVGRGYFPESVVTEVNQLMHRELEKAGARLTAVYYCPHGSADTCGCRKPKLGMVRRAAEEHSIDIERSFFVGDRRSDIELGHNAGGKSILVRTGYGEGEFTWQMAKWPKAPDFVAIDLAAAVDWILRNKR